MLLNHLPKKKMSHFKYYYILFKTRSATGPKEFVEGLRATAISAATSWHMFPDKSAKKSGRGRKI
jgi:hypothetical protein